MVIFGAVNKGGSTMRLWGLVTPTPRFFEWVCKISNYVYFPTSFVRKLILKNKID